MNWEAIGAVAELLNIAALLVNTCRIIYVAIQIRVNTRLSQDDAIHARRSKLLERRRQDACRLRIATVEIAPIRRVNTVRSPAYPHGFYCH